MTTYLTRSQAAAGAKRASLTWFHTSSFPKTPQPYWKYHDMGQFPKPELADWAKGKDYVHHIEVGFTKDADDQTKACGVMVVTCSLEDLPQEDVFDAAEKGFRFEPITPSLWTQADPDTKSASTGGPREKSAIESPVKVVWRIADEMQGADRAAVIAACVEAGVNKSTASTQFYKWQKAQKG